MDEFAYHPGDHVIPEYCEIPIYLKNISTGDRVKIVVRCDDETHCRILTEQIKDVVKKIMNDV